MTKLRAPLSFEQALLRIAGEVTWERMAELTGRAVRTLKEYSDEDVSTSITLRDAFALETEYRRTGGEGAPFHDCWRARLGMIGGTLASTDQLLAQIAVTVVETGDATAASIRAASHDATEGDRQIAVREIEQAIFELQKKLSMLTHTGQSP